MSFSAPPTPPPIVLPSTPPPAPVFGQSASGQKPGAKPSQPTYLGSALFAQPAQQGAKTLLGQ